MATPAPQSAPAGLDLTTETSSETGLYRVSYQSELDPVTINQLHRWKLHVQTADGKAVTGAKLTVDGGMPEHNHGMPTTPAVTADLGNGDYQVEGMQFQMPGRWVVTVTIDADDATDKATFNLFLK
ncbi:MAG: FixH family protein [Anaerolineales bacterium]|nr:FixH family protein [Anaerolineales bacterium]